MFSVRFLFPHTAHLTNDNGAETMLTVQSLIVLSGIPLVSAI